MISNGLQKAKSMLFQDPAPLPTTLPLAHTELKDVRAALKNKIWFELCYGEALRDSTSRMWFFANAGALARATRGGRDGVILSSGVERAIDVRSMHDVVNLATLFGMRESDARAAMTTQPYEMIALAGKRRLDASAA